MSRRLLVVLTGILVAAGGLQLATVRLERSVAAPATTPRGRSDAAPAAERFRERLRREGGEAIAPGRMGDLGRGVAARVEARMDEIATEILPESDDWRPIFDSLAKEHPPTEEAVLELYREELARAESFVRDRRLTPLPAEPLRVEVVGNRVLRRVFPLALYVDPGRLGIVLRPPYAEEPSPKYLANHCSICVPPLAVHEGFPGHHVAYGLARETDERSRRANGRPPGAENMTYQEGWAQYAELAMLESGYWRGAPGRELGALRLVLLRALRAEIDGALVTGGLDPTQATRLYVERVRMTEAAARAEVAGHLDEPGRKSSYLLGALQILALRHEVGLGTGASSLYEFHGRFLERPARIPDLARRRFGVALNEESLVVDRIPLRPTAGEGP